MIPIVFSIFAAPMAASVMTSAAAGRFPFVAASENTLFSAGVAAGAGRWRGRWRRRRGRWRKRRGRWRHATPGSKANDRAKRGGADHALPRPRSILSPHARRERNRPPSQRIAWR
jgi:hypothetical protein